MFDYPERSITLQFEGGKEYEMPFPKTGQIYDIQAEKAKILKGQLGSILDSSTNDGNYAVVLADMQAHFTILCPKLLSDLQVKSISELEAIDSAKLLKVFVDQCLPWLREWKEILQSGGIQSKSEEVKKEEPVKKEEKKQEEVSDSKFKIKAD